MINSTLDFAALNSSYKYDNRLRIDNFLIAQVCEELHELAKTQIPYYLAYTSDSRPSIMKPTEFDAMTREQRHEFWSSRYEQASRGVGYVYKGFMPKNANLGSDKTLLPLKEFAEYWTSDVALEKIRQLSGMNDLTHSDAQFTCLLPGHFLTRHRDTDPSGKRRLAYTIGLTKNWHPDWGGLLQFYEDDGTPRDSWGPKFNTLSIFDIDHIHSVTHITPYALEPRLSIVGWFYSE